MDDITLKTAVNGLGLLLDIAGVLMMFEKIDVRVYLFEKGEVNTVNRRKNKKLFIGLSLLLAGFILQFIALFFINTFLFN